MKKLLIILLSFISYLGISQTLLQGKISRVYDGDTFILTSDSIKTRIRIEGCDTPEQTGYVTKDQPFARIATDSIKKLLLNKDVKVIVTGVDKYGRTLGKVMLDTIDVSEYILSNGLGWYLSTNLKDDRSKYKKLRNKAKKAKLGLWTDENAVNPKVWRELYAIIKH